jgi:hypothetical protein
MKMELIEKDEFLGLNVGCMWVGDGESWECSG